MLYLIYVPAVKTESHLELLDHQGRVPFSILRPNFLKGAILHNRYLVNQRMSNERY